MNESKNTTEVLPMHKQGNKPDVNYRSISILNYFSNCLKRLRYREERQTVRYRQTHKHTHRKRERDGAAEFSHVQTGPPFVLQLGATWLSPGHERPWLSLEVFLLLVHRTGTSYLNSLKTFFQYHFISSAST